MKKLLEFLKRIFTIIKGWVVANGVEGILGVILGAILWSAGYEKWAVFVLGVFATRNWDIIKAWLLKLVK